MNSKISINNQSKIVKKGHQSQQFIEIKNIRQILRNLGLNEIVSNSINECKTDCSNTLEII